MTCPEIMRKSKRILYAYVHSHPQNQVMGVTIDGSTGKTIQAVILPTRQRVMLGLGVGDDKTHAHSIYRQLYPGGYVLRWSDDPYTDPRMEDLQKHLAERPRKLREADVHVTEDDAQEPAERSQESVGSFAPTGQLTTELVRRGAEAAKPSTSRPTSPEPPLHKDSNRRDSNGTTPQHTPPNKSTHGGFF